MKGDEGGCPLSIIILNQFITYKPMHLHEDNEIFAGERLYDPDAHLDEEGTKEHLDRYKFALNILNGSEIVVDAACGSGYGSAILAKKVKKVIGLEISDHALNYAKSHYNASNLEFRKADLGSKLDIPDAFCDAVICFETLEHIVTQEAALAEFRRILKPNGLLLISTPDRDLMSEGGEESDNPFHVKELNKKEFLDLTGSFFKVEALYGQAPMRNMPGWKRALKIFRRINFLRKSKQWFAKKLGITRFLHKHFIPTVYMPIERITKEEPSRFYILIAACRNDQAGMRQVFSSSSFPCPACGSSHVRNLYKNLDKTYRVNLFKIQRQLNVAKCMACGTAFTQPQLDYQEIAPYFSDAYGSFQVKSRKITNPLARVQAYLKRATLNHFFDYGDRKWWGFVLYPIGVLLRHFPEKVQNGRVLDVGCGSGNFLANLKDLGWETYGIDPSPVAVRVAQDRGLKNIFCGTLGETHFEENFFDAVVLFHVFEHIPNPDIVLPMIKKTLKPNGQLIIGVPNFASFGSCIFKKHWAGLSFPLHYVHYDKNSLAHILHKYEFKIQSVYYANLFSDIVAVSPESMANAYFGYKTPRWIGRCFYFLNFVGNGLDYLFGNLLANIFGIGAQITIVSKNGKQ